MTGIVSGCLASGGQRLCLLQAAGPPPVIYYPLIPKSITSSIAVSVSEEIGGISALTVALVVLHRPSWGGHRLRNGQAPPS